eukprot:gene13857-biopygen568
MPLGVYPATFARVTGPAALLHARGGAAQTLHDPYGGATQAMHEKESVCTHTGRDKERDGCSRRRVVWGCDGS